MHWLIRFGMWLDRRRVLRATDLDTINENHARLSSNTLTLIKSLEKKIEDAQAAQQVPQAIAKEFALLKVRLDRLELLVGLKREPAAAEVPGAARIA